jgi:hypothetical protein
MRRLYQAILSLYPAGFRAAFAAEMIAVFDKASADARKKGVLKFMSFTISEITGLVKGFLSEHAARWKDGEAYLTSRCTGQPQPGHPTEIVEAERHLEYVLRSMEFAIAHHDFPKARYFSNEEYAARARLQQLTATLISPQK